MDLEQVELPSERELELLQLVSEGLTNREIATRLSISPNTVKVHLRNIYAKLKVGSRTEATMVAVRQGWVQVEGADAQQSGGAARQAGDSLEGPEAAGAQLAVSTSRRRVPLEPLAAWQRIYLVVSALLVLLGLVVIWPDRAGQKAPFSDRPAQASTWSPTKVSRWQGLAQMPTPRGRLAVAMREGEILAIGGESATGVTNAVEVYAPAEDSWFRGADKTTAAANVGAAVIQGKVYVPGGSTSEGQISDLLEVYDRDDGPRGAWSSAQSMPAPRSAYAIAADQEALYVFGGWDGDTYVSSAFRYAPDDDLWSALAPMPTGRAFAGAGLIGRQVYVVGGYDGQSELSTCEVYDIEADSWASCPSMHAPRGGAGAAVIADTLFVIGGGWDSYLVENEYYSPAQGEWKTFPSPILEEWRNLGVAPNGTFLYAIGGWGGDPLDANQAYRALYRIYMPGSSG